MLKFIKENLPFVGDAIKAGASLWEGKKNRSLAKDQFRSQMDESVQRRVADAQKAGIHPLFALGASVGSSPTTVAGSSGIAAAGDALGNAVSRAGQKKPDPRIQQQQDQLTQAQIHALNAQAGRDAADAAVLDSQRARIEQEMHSQGRDGVKGVTEPYAFGKQRGSITYGPPKTFTPEVPTQSRTGVRSGISPMYEQFVDRDGSVVEFFSTELQADELRQAQIAAHVAKRDGKSASGAFRKWLEDRGIRYKSSRRKPRHDQTYNPKWVSP